MSLKNIITGLDLGSKTIRVAIGRIEDNRIEIIGIAEHLSEGISKGVIINIEDTVSSISATLEKAERMAGTEVEHVYVGISGSHIISQESRGVVAISKADGEIREDDVKRVLETAQTVATPPNYEVLHIIPRAFTVDNQPGIKEPIGMTGVRLEVDAQIILGLSNQIKNLTKCLYRAGVEVDEIVFNILAAAEATLARRQKDLGVVILNLGDTTTGFAVFEEGDILTAKILPIGARHITSDIAIALRVHSDLAEKIKVDYGTALVEKAGEEIIDLKKIDSNEEGVFSKKGLAKVIRSRCEEIFKAVNSELENIGRSEKLPSGVVLTGAGAKLNGIVDLSKEIFRLPAAVVSPYGFKSVIDKVFDPSFSTACGLVLWGKEQGAIPHISSFNKIGSKLRNFLRSLFP